MPLMDPKELAVYIECNYSPTALGLLVWDHRQMVVDALRSYRRSMVLEQAAAMYDAEAAQSLEPYRPGL